MEAGWPMPATAGKLGMALRGKEHEETVGDGLR
jgi:hypothetical protein